MHNSQMFDHTFELLLPVAWARCGCSCRYTPPSRWDRGIRSVGSWVAGSCCILGREVYCHDRERSWWAVEHEGTFVAQCFFVMCVGLLLVVVPRIFVVTFLVFMFRILRVDLLTFVNILEVVWTTALDSFLDHGAALDVARTKAFSAGKWRVWAQNAMYTWISISKLGAKFRRRARLQSFREIMLFIGKPKGRSIMISNYGRLSLFHFVKRLRCIVAGRVVDQAFRGSELRLAYWHRSC